MKALVITSKGLESISALEVKELLGTSTETAESVVIFGVKSEEEICRLCYLGRSFSRVLLLLQRFEIENQDDIEKKFSADVPELLKGRTFAVRCERIGEHGFSSPEIARAVGELILKKNEAKVDLKNPDIIFYVYVCGRDFYFGVDYSGFDLSKRSYRIFSHPASIRGALAYAMLRFAGYGANDVLLDPFCGGGTIPVEAALLATNTPPRFHDKNALAFQKIAEFDFSRIDAEIKSGAETKILASDSATASIRAADKNAKIAGVKEKITFAKLEIEVLDKRIDKNSVDKIVTNPPQLEDKQLRVLAREFFRQANYALKNEGIVVLLCRNPSVWKEEANGEFAPKDEREVFSGKEKLTMLKFIKR